MVRSSQLRSDTAQFSLFRAPSSLTSRLRSDTAAFGAAVVLPHIRFVRNSDLPYSLNDGALWAGRGNNVDVVGGARVEWGRLRLLMLPEFVFAANDSFGITIPTLFPPLPDSRNVWSSPFHPRNQSIDLPIRFGDKPIQKLHRGQSALVVNAGQLDIGAATENEWWGPGVRNALLISNHAAGFPHVFVRTARPLATPLGRVEARWIAGGLSGSGFYYSNREDSLRQIALLGATLQPRGVDGLTLGAARSVFGPSRNWRSALTSFFEVFHDVGQPDAVPLSAFSLPPGPDQLLSFFLRWMAPRDGFEVYGEWGRAEFPKSLRDFLVQPNHTQAYTVGLQWLGTELERTGGQLRVQGEASFLQQSSTYRHRPLGSWYTSTSVRHGYTEQGQVLGASIGPGSSSQWIALDHLASSWSLGAYVNRIRWLEDARSQYFTELPLGNGWCEHDVSLLGGLRASIATRTGTFAADYSTGWRYNVFFNHDMYSCPFNQGQDVRNKSLTLTFSPSFRRR